MTHYYTKSLTVKQYDGSTKRLKFRGKTPEEVQRKFQEAKIKYDMGLLAIKPSTTFARWEEEWEDSYLKPTKSAADAAQFSTILRKYFMPYIGNVKLADLLPLHIQSCANRLADYSVSQVAKARIAISDVIKKAVANKLITDDITKDVLWPKGQPMERRALYEHERAILWELLPKHPNGLFFAIMYGCGLRNSEVRALQWSDIDEKEGVIHVSRAVKKSTGKIGPPKSKAGIRNVPIPPWLMEWLKSQPKKAIYVIPNEKGGFVSEARVRKAWASLQNQMLIAAGVPTYRNQVDPELRKGNSIDELKPYSLRHTYCTILAENDVPIKEAQYLMGHSDISMTARIYTHVSAKVEKNVQNRINIISDWGNGKGTQEGHILQITC